MSEFLEAIPENWKYRLILSAVSRDGTPFEDSVSLVIDKKLSYWSQVYTLKTPVDAEIEAPRTSEGRLFLSVSITSEAEVPCARCLEPAAIAVKGSLRYLFSLRPNEYSEDKEEGLHDGDEELIILDSWEDEIDIAPMIWETLITSLPAAALCSEECRGLCPQCGANINKSECGCKSEKGDPRFDILKTLMHDK